ncbi:MAG: hypothetical protein ACFFCM_12285 [Promethearchaeota archaeon]
MLNNNDFCQWRDFTSEPLIFPESTLSNYLRKLIIRELVIKKSIVINENGTQRNKKIYKITQKGQKRLNEIESFEKNNIKFPPNNLKFFDSKDKILWMLFNNPYCQWRVFLNEPLNINQSTLSNKLNHLRDKNLIKKSFVPELKHAIYKITLEGKKKYFDIFKNYNLDSLTLWFQELKSLGKLNEIINNFFKKFEIENIGVKKKFKDIKFFLFLNHSDLKHVFYKEQDLNLTILFFAINYIENYPNYISSEDFCKKYPLKKRNLDYFIGKIVKEKIFQSTYFRLKLSDNIYCYFSEGDNFEKFLNIITTNYIKEKFYEFCEEPYNIVEIAGSNARRNIAILVCDKYRLIHKDLELPLSKILGKYINYILWSERKYFIKTSS